MSSQKQAIVVVGAGHAGSHIARSLSGKLDPAKYDITLIGIKPFFTFMPAMIRYTTYASPDLLDKPVMSYDKLFIKGNGHFKVGTVESIQHDVRNVVLKGGETIKYDALIIATGSKWEGNLAFPEAPEEWDGWLHGTRRRIEEANSIVLVGGGAVGSGEWLTKCSDLVFLPPVVYRIRRRDQGRIPSTFLLLNLVVLAHSIRRIRR
jgi:apoptosis-inducing factor 2